ncbi:hypothetical protein ACJX0J_010442, partial [Zea mays]
SLFFPVFLLWEGVVTVATIMHVSVYITCMLLYFLIIFSIKISQTIVLEKFFMTKISYIFLKLPDKLYSSDNIVTSFLLTTSVLVIPSDKEHPEVQTRTGEQREQAFLG